MSNLNTNTGNQHSSQNNSKANRLINEKSPYLLQHAHNPVDWYPWCDEAFDKAKKEDKPIFLSIGYSTCHWCHVMAHESFEDAEVAERLNKDFISIKVDREERPDVDAVYMAVCQAMTGSGGWPLTILMTSEQKPFFAGTYFPKHSRLNMPGMMELLEKIAYNWKNNRHQLTDAADTLTEFLQGGKRDETPGFEADFSDENDPKETIAEAVSLFYNTFDKTNGGFGRAPKFPTPHNLMLLMRYYNEEDDKQALQMVEKTLQQMYRGGLFDHIGGGFARYSTDSKWLAPHFEKMLYDNALLVTTYLEAHEITGNPLYRRIAEKTMEYISKEMTDETGGFYSAQDADSEGEEGKFYTFTPEEIINVLGKDDGEHFNAFFDITQSGNFEGKNIVNLLKNSEYKMPDLKIERAMTAVYNYRASRMSLHKDDKILTSWNCLMIAAFAKAYKVIHNSKYLQHAKDALQFIEQNMVNAEGRLLARYRKGEAGILGYLDDYAFFAYALIEMYEATGEEQYWQRAEVITKEMLGLFSDENQGGFYLYANDAERLIARPKELYDGAVPSGNSVAAYNLVKLAHLSPNDSKLGEIAYRQLKIFSKNVKQYPAGYSFFMLALMQEVYHKQERVMVGCGPQGCSIH